MSARSPLSLFLLILLSCSPAMKPVETADDRPAWLKSRPSSQDYYTGIGHSIKTSSVDHVQAARNKALEGLLSEIKVSVQGTTILNVVDAGKDFSERYQQVVKTSVSEELEDYEQAGAFEDAGNYWVYLRLSKARFQEIKEKRRRAAATLAQDLFVKARQATAENQLAVALGFYFQSMQALEKYMADPIRVTVDGQEIVLNTAIISGIQLLLDRVELRMDAAQINLNRRMSGQTQPLRMRAVDKTTGRSVADLPLQAVFSKGAGDLAARYKTGAKGEVTLNLTRITSAEPEQTIRVKLDPAAGGQYSELMNLLVSRLVLPEASLLLRVNRPTIHLVADERQWGTNRGQARLSGAVRQFLTTQGFDFTDRAERAELVLDIRSDTEKGSVSGSIYISFLNASLRVLTADRRSEICSATLDRVKGYSLDYERSAQDAYTKGIEMLEKEKLPALLNTILQ